MAIFPCEYCGKRYLGKQQTIYVHVTEKDVDLNRKLRLCQKDFEDLHHQLMMRTLCTVVGTEIVQFDEDDLVLKCFKCERPTEGPSLFATTFPYGDNSRSFWGRVCPEDRDAVLEAFKIAP